MKPLILAALTLGAHAAAPSVLLRGPEITKLTWDTRGLATADFDGDGKGDLALVNNENAKIVLLYQRAPGEAAKKDARRAVVTNRWEPVLEDSRFEKVSLPADQRHHAVVAADFDGDKRPDLAFTGAEDALVVRFQGADATFSKTWKNRDFEALQGTKHLQTADLNGDNRADLAVLGKGKLLVFLQKDGGGFGEASTFATGEEKPGQLFAEDADSDGKTDLLYFAANPQPTIRWRRQLAPGQFSAEAALPFEQPAWSIETSRDAAGALVFTFVNAKSNLIERRKFTAAAPGTGDDKLVPTVNNPPAGMKVAAHAIADFDGDGLTDVALADGKAAQVALYFQQPGGSFAEPRTFPSFAGIAGLAAVAGEKGATLAVVSRKEGFGISALKDGRLEFPTVIPVKGEPAFVATVNGNPVVLADEKGSWRLDAFALADGKWTAESRSFKPTREPAGLAAGDLNGDGRDELIVCIPRDPALIFPGAAKGFGEPLKETANIRSQLSDLAPERLALLDLDGDKRAEIVTSSAGFARSVKLTDADVAVADQFNARQPDDKLSAPAFFDTDGDGTAELVFNENGSAFFQILKRDNTGVYRAARRVQAAAGDSVRALPVALGTAKAPSFLVVTRDRFWTAPFTGAGARLELAASYDTDLKNCTYYAAVPGDVNGDGREEIVAFDRESNLIEFLTPGATGQPWRSLMHFVLFEVNIHFRGRKGEGNVREIIIRDFTGDGRPDVALLVHDRLLLFPQG